MAPLTRDDVDDTVAWMRRVPDSFLSGERARAIIFYLYEQGHGTPTIKKAAELLRFNAFLVRESSTAGTEGTDWNGEDEAKADYDELIAVAQTLDPVDVEAEYKKHRHMRYGD